MRVPCYLRTQHFSFLFPPSMSLFFLMNLRWIKYFSCYFRNFIMLQSHFLLRQLSHISSLLTSTCRYNLLKYNYNCLGFVISKIRCLMFLMFHALLLLQSGSISATCSSSSLKMLFSFFWFAIFAGDAISKACTKRRRN